MSKLLPNLYNGYNNVINYFYKNNELLKYKKYGWKRDIPDIRDKEFEVDYLMSVENNTIKIDLRNKCPPVYNQGELGSCTANAIACAIQFDELKQNLKSEIPSRLFIYYNERDIEGTINIDNGSSLRDGVKCINKIGYCNETQWPYDISKFTEKPNKECYNYANNHKSLSYKKVLQDENYIKSVLNMEFPIVFGISVYESFESENVKQTGIVPLPNNNEKLLGGHAIVLVGYDNEKQIFIFRNSWGNEWGDNGYGYLPYEYVCNKNLASDFWVITKIC